MTVGIDRIAAIVNFALPFVEWHLRSTVCPALAARANFRSENCAVAVLAQTSLEPVCIMITSILINNMT